MKVPFLIFFLAGLLWAGQTFSQTITGYVRDAESGESLSNVNIYSSNSGTYATSNEYGY
ncbi:MAG: hypothetical protein ACI8UX_001434, partial [Psychromonas sp.]